jgi:hypothetical protein
VVSSSRASSGPSCRESLLSRDGTNDSSFIMSRETSELDPKAEGAGEHKDGHDHDQQLVLDQSQAGLASAATPAAEGQPSAEGAAAGEAGAPVQGPA